MARLIGRLLHDRRWTVAVAEYLTGGLLVRLSLRALLDALPLSRLTD
jgi:nicotinamide mononucleotide (NMN) deamidase PncC